MLDIVAVQLLVWHCCSSLVTCFRFPTGARGSKKDRTVVADKRAAEVNTAVRLFLYLCLSSVIEIFVYEIEAFASSMLPPVHYLARFCLFVNAPPDTSQMISGCGKITGTACLEAAKTQTASQLSICRRRPKIFHAFVGLEFFRLQATARDTERSKIGGFGTSKTSTASQPPNQHHRCFGTRFKGSAETGKASCSDGNVFKFAT